MRQAVILSVLLLSAAMVGLAIAAHCPSCLDSNRVNKTCTWSGDAQFPIDPQNELQQTHLVADVQLAEDLAIRYADAEFLRLYGYEAHGGLIDNHRVLNECMASLVARIENNHAVTSSEVALARGKRDVRFDSVAALSFLPIYLVGAAVASRRLYQRFSADQPVVRWSAVGFASVAASALGFQLVQLWLAVWEAIRVRNGHMSMFRTATHDRWPHTHAGALLVGGMVLFWLTAMLSQRVPQSVTLYAALAACAMLGAMFVDVFVSSPAAYTLALVGAVGTIFVARFLRPLAPS
jgi:hypothetical protein